MFFDSAENTKYFIIKGETMEYIDDDMVEQKIIM
jgi:hypothetical protein